MRISTSEGKQTKRGEAKKLTMPDGTVEQWTFNGNGATTAYTNGLSQTVTYVYDDAGRNTSVDYPAGTDTTFVYDDANRRTSMVDATGTTTWNYNNASQLTSIVQPNGSGGTYTVSFSPNSSGRRTNVDGITTTYAYDAAGQLSSETRTGYAASYTYDGNGNRLTKTLGGVTEDYVYDDGDKLAEIKIGSTVVKDFDYEACGRTTKIQTSAYTRNFSYDYESRVTAVTGLSTNNSFEYNGFDTRVKKVDSSGTSNYQRLGAGVTGSLLSDGSATYTPGVSERRSGSTAYLHAGLKNADLRTNSGQTNLGTKRYDAFGLQVGGIGTWVGPLGYAGKFGYQSSEDAEIMLLGHRYYDPSTGRFLTRDPIKDGRNWYAYCGNSPLKRQDASGLKWHDPVQVTVDSRFDGRVIGFGDFSWMDREGWRDCEIGPGMASDNRMDVDMVLIIRPKSRPQFVFLPGAGIPGDGTEISTCYLVDADGNIRHAIDQTPAIPVGYRPLEWWDGRWTDWIDEAYRTGLPKGYQPKQSPLQPCVWK